MLRRSPKRSHVPSKYEAGSQKCCKDLANTKLDLRNAANSLQIEGKGAASWGPNPWGEGGVERRRTGPYIYINSFLYINVLSWLLSPNCPWSSSTELQKVKEMGTCRQEPAGGAHVWLID